MDAADDALQDPEPDATRSAAPHPEPLNAANTTHAANVNSTHAATGMTTAHAASSALAAQHEQSGTLSSVATAVDAPSAAPAAATVGGTDHLASQASLHVEPPSAYSGAKTATNSMSGAAQQPTALAHIPAQPAAPAHGVGAEDQHLNAMDEDVSPPNAACGAFVAPFPGASAIFPPPSDADHSAGNAEGAAGAGLTPRGDDDFVMEQARAEEPAWTGLYTSIAERTKLGTRRARQSRRGRGGSLTPMRLSQSARHAHARVV